MFKLGWKRNCKKAGVTALLAVSTAGLVAPAVQAAVSDFTDFASSRELSDSELGKQRGRFVDRGRLMFFGVQMTTEWRTSQGEHLMVQGNLRGDLSGNTPKVTFEPRFTTNSVNVQGTAALTDNGATVRDAGTGNARGVVQSIQAAGDFNAAANDLQIDVLRSSTRGSEGVTTAGSVPNDTRISVTSGPDALGVGLAIPGMGSVNQSIVPNRGLRQSIQLTSDLQQVRNQTRLQLYMGEPGVNAAVPGVNRAVDSVRQLRR